MVGRTLPDMPLGVRVSDGVGVTLEDGLKGVQNARTKLAKAIADRTDLPRRLVNDPEAMDTLLESAETLESFATGLLAAARIEGAGEAGTADFSFSAAG